MKVEKFGEQVRAKFLENVMQTHMFFKKDNSREEEKKSDRKGEKLKLPKKQTQKRNEEKKQVRKEKSSAEGEIKALRWKEKIKEIINADGPVTKDKFKDLKANKEELLKDITNEIF